jgi:hypothetical protein
MINIYEYIKETQFIRQLHINLSEPCKEIGGNSTVHKGILATYLNTTIPKGYAVLLCHKCNNSKCSNVKHLYFGTPKENVEDSKHAGTWKNAWDYKVAKYGYQEACKRNSYK